MLLGSFSSIVPDAGFHRPGVLLEAFSPGQRRSDSGQLVGVADSYLGKASAELCGRQP
jgi:hypothetical protein